MRVLYLAAAATLLGCATLSTAPTAAARAGRAYGPAVDDDYAMAPAESLAIGYTVVVPATGSIVSPGDY